MNPDELESLLRRYRPAGPPPALRGRILATVPHRQRTWPWAAAAAVLLASTIALQLSARDLRREFRSGRGPGAVVQSSDEEILREYFGPDEHALRAVQLAMDMQRRREDAVTSAPSPTWP